MDKQDKASWMRVRDELDEANRKEQVARHKQTDKDAEEMFTQLEPIAIKMALNINSFTLDPITASMAVSLKRIADALVEQSVLQRKLVVQQAEVQEPKK